jgi:molybdopterin-guanine dinucleotide biosynthesis protein A
VTLPRAELGAVVLAGGGSRRMGVPKALLEWHGSPLVVRVARLLERVAGTVVVVGASGQRLPAIPGAVFAVDAAPQRGPLQGIAAGLSALEGQCEAAFVAATDQPLLHPAFVLQVVDGLAGYEAAVPECDGRAHPLAAAYDLRLRRRAEQLLSAGELRATALAEGARTARLDASALAHPESLWNINTPEGYDRLLQLPEPLVQLDGTPMRAATIGRLLGQLPPGAALMLGSRRVDDPTVPLADGDVLSMVTQTRARSTSST